MAVKNILHPLLTIVRTVLRVREGVVGRQLLRARWRSGHGGTGVAPWTHHEHRHIGQDSPPRSPTDRNRLRQARLRLAGCASQRASQRAGQRVELDHRCQRRQRRFSAELDPSPKGRGYDFALHAHDGLDVCEGGVLSRARDQEGPSAESARSHSHSHDRSTEAHIPMRDGDVQELGGGELSPGSQMDATAARIGRGSACLAARAQEAI